MAPEEVMGEILQDLKLRSTVFFHPISNDMSLAGYFGDTGCGLCKRLFLKITEDAVKKNGVNLGNVVPDNIRKQPQSDLQSISVGICHSHYFTKKEERKKDKLPLPSEGIAWKLFDS